MKRTALKRGAKRLSRRQPLRSKRAKARRSGRARDEAYMAWVRTLPCCAPHGLMWLCNGGTEAHHAGRRATGRKADDDTCIPLSMYCHRWWHAAAGPFAGWTRDRRRTWADARITETQALWAKRAA